jgi:hypothetical protein
MNDLKTKRDKKWIYLIFLTISILCSIFFSIPANAAVGDLILDTKIELPFNELHEPHEATPLATTLLKEGYSLSLDDVYDICCGDKTTAGLTIYKNEEIVERMKVKRGDYIYYNKTIGGREYTIIESKLDAILLGSTYDIVQLRPFYQYSDGSTIIEPDFISTNLNPKIKETPYEEWNRSFGGIYSRFADNVWSVQQTSDDGYILLGKMAQSPWAELIKIDENGNEQWNKTFGDFGYTSSVLQLHDGGYIFLGINSTEGMPAVLVKTDVNGNQQWSKKFGGTDDYSVNSVQNTLDGGYILAGMKWSRWPRDAILVKTNSNGSEEWRKTFGLDGVISPSSVRETPDGGYILTGITDWRDDIRIDEAWLLKTDSNGTEQWNRTIGIPGYDSVSSVQNTLDGGYILAGWTLSYGTGGDAWLLKTDANGNEQWNRTFGLDGFDSAYSVEQTSDGGYVLAGQIDTAKNPDFKGQILYENLDAWLFKTDANGNLEWSKTIGGLKRDTANFVQQTSDGGYVIAGTTESDSSGDSESWLIKVSGDPEGTGNISVTNRTGTWNIKRNFTGISNRTEKLAASPTQTLIAVPPETSTMIPPEKAAGFEVVMAIMMLLAVYSAGQKRG